MIGFAFELSGRKKIEILLCSFHSSTYAFQGVEADHFDKLERPRVFKTHLPVQLLPPQIWEKNAKIVFISRDVKDVAVSCYFIRKLFFREVMGTMEEHLEEFLNDRMWYAPYREYLKNFDTLRDKPNVLFLIYEEATVNKEETIRKVAKFLGKEVSDENVKKLAAHLDFKAMKSRFFISSSFFNF